jgi:hypothetical protein
MLFDISFRPEKLTITLGFEKNANFFAENCRKIAKSCDHNIDHRPTTAAKAEPKAVPTPTTAMAEGETEDDDISQLEHETQVNIKASQEWKTRV